MINHDLHRIEVKITLFSNKTKVIQINTVVEINPHIIQLIILHQMMRNFIIKIINDSIQANDHALTVLINQTFSNHTFVMSKRDTQEIIQHHTIKFFNHKTQSIQNLTNQLKCITKFYYRNTYNNMKKKTKNQFTNFSKLPNAAESLQMTMNPNLMGLMG